MNTDVHGFPEAVACPRRSPRCPRQLAPVVGFLACVLALAKLCDDDGLFRACGAWLARAIPADPGGGCGHLSNSASLLLPVSNLTNLLVFGVSGLSFGGFIGLHAIGG